MAEKKEYVPLWLSYRTYFEQYDPEQIGNIVLAMLDYKEHGIDPNFEGDERFVWPAIRREIDMASESQQKQSDTNRENGKKGGRPHKPIAFSETEENPKNPSVFLEAEKSHSKEKNSKEKNCNETNTTRASARDAAFETFWAEYPKKVGKAAARKAFDEVKVPLETLVDAVKSQKCSEQWTRENGRFIPNPTTWLNQGRWDDTLSPPSTPTSAPGCGVSTDDMDLMVQAAQWAAEQGGQDG